MTVEKQCRFYHNLSFDASKPFLTHGPSLVSCSTLAQNTSHLYPISLHALTDLACLLLELVKVELAAEWLVVVMVKGMARIPHRG